jgi:hypothetical protein
VSLIQYCTKSTYCGSMGPTKFINLQGYMLMRKRHKSMNTKTNGCVEFVWRRRRVVYSIYIDLKTDLKRGNRYKHGFVFTYAPSTFVICNNLCCHPIDVMFCIYLKPQDNSCLISPYSPGRRFALTLPMNLLLINLSWQFVNHCLDLAMLCKHYCSK